MVITVSGTSGTGTTTLCEKLAQEFQLNYVYAGRIMREMASEKKMDIVEFGSYLLNHLDIDIEVDQRIIDEAKKGNALLEGRLSGFMVKKGKIKAFKILLIVTEDLRIQRIAYRDNMTLNEAKVKIAEREQTNWERYKKLYDIDHDDQSIYDLIIDTSKLSIEEVFRKAKKAIEKYRASLKKVK